MNNNLFCVKDKVVLITGGCGILALIWLNILPDRVVK